MAYATVIAILAIGVCSSRVSSSCPSNCSCPADTKRVYCIAASLTSIPLNITEDTIDWINLHDNNIQNVLFGASSELGRVRFLDLSYNSISHIEVGAFNGLTNLYELRLQNNAITHITAGVFTDCPNLYELSLYSNDISNIGDGTFTGLVNLYILWLHGNAIGHIESGAFAQLTTLHYLELSDNNLTSLPEGVFLPLSRIKSVDLHGNPWHCNCSLLRWLQTQNNIHLYDIYCSTPLDHASQRLNDILPGDLCTQGNLYLLNLCFGHE